MVGSPASERGFLAVSALFFAACAAVTVIHCASMPTMGEMAGRGCGQTWLGAAASFLAMWAVMMAAMMLPSLVPTLMRYRQAVGGTGAARRDCLTAVVGLGYFLVWLLTGTLVYGLGLALAPIDLQLPALTGAAPLAASLVVMIAGALQFTPWKARHLAHCRAVPTRDASLQAGVGKAWRHGLRLGLHCNCSCIGLTAVLLVIGIMDLRAMIVVTAAVTIERLSPEGRRVAQAIGAIVIGAGMVLLARAAGIGG